MTNIALVHYGSNMTLWNSNAQTLIIGTTAEGASSKGIMADWRNYDAQAWLAYQRLCVEGKVVVGQPVLIRSTKHAGKQYILCPLRAKSSERPSVTALLECLGFIWQHGASAGITSIATHKMGCGGDPEKYLTWELIAPLYMGFFSRMPVPVSIHVGRNDQLPTGDMEFEIFTVQREHHTDPIMATPF